MLSRTRLLQMTSQAFPIGGYSHSHALEAAIEGGLVNDESSVLQWLRDVFAFSLATYEMPLLCEMSLAWGLRDVSRVCVLNAEFLATREAAELRGATVQMGFSMRTLLAVLPAMPGYLLDTLQALPEPSLPCVWSGASQAWEIPVAESAAAYLWSWAENQVLVAMKSVPIGQSSGQRVLLEMGGEIARITQALPASLAEVRRSNFAPGLAILSSQHETQYSRLFRS